MCKKLEVINTFITIMLIAISNLTFAQVGIGTTTPQTTLDIRATNHLGAVTGSDGVLVPRVNSLGVSGSQNGQLVYLTVDDSVNGYIKGFYYWDANAWNRINTSGTGSWVNDSAGFQISSTGTNPTKATTRQFDIASHRILPNGEIEVKMIYAADSNSGASNGSGTYLFTLPNGLQFDTAKHTTYTGTSVLSNSIVGAYALPTTVNINTASGYYSSAVIIPYNSTQFRLISIGGNSNNEYIASGHYSFGANDRTIHLIFTFNGL
ncbi:hypothetical protein L3X37_12835 [Sabulilitoribacter arenilitoris]|uniref:Uncharacterized protein n=1 Tax=Wocania arenilitoris TaxID=2044858 RepID=A0AAE3JME5_9FLAO|nr:hypothetical protein [Wocania arenilitoris]MCF7569242.1 hypothetical protein [Wocania arenilitoris]